MKLRYLAILPVVMFGVSGAQAHGDDEMGGHHFQEMLQRIFGDKDSITKEEFMKQKAEKFDKISKGKDTVTKDQFLSFVKAKHLEHMKKKYCSQ